MLTDRAEKGDESLSLVPDERYLLLTSRLMSIGLHAVPAAAFLAHVDVSLALLTTVTTSNWQSPSGRFWTWRQDATLILAVI